jgi:hypothetical protein
MKPASLLWLVAGAVVAAAAAAFFDVDVVG